MIDREIKIMICARNPTIISFIGYSKHDFQDENNITIIMELDENNIIYSNKSKRAMAPKTIQIQHDK